MYNSNPPAKTDLPSKGKLIKSTILAAAAASVLLVTVVMPAEYGIDPTGIGKVTGLKKMGDIKSSLAKEVAAEAEQAKIQTPEVAQQPVVQELVVTTPKPEIIPQPEINNQNHERQFTLAPNEGLEIKLKMNKGSKAQYVWWTDGGRANFDIHGDSKPLKIKYHNYAKGSKTRDEGIIEAEFTGTHGWFWRNRTPKTLTIILQTNGDYLELQE